MGYDNLKLEKGMYRQEGMSFTQVLESLDPSENYRGTAMEGRMSFSSMPWRTVREMYSGNRTAESMVAKNFSTVEEPAPLARMPKRFS